MTPAMPWSKRPEDTTVALAREHISLLRGLVGVLDQIEQWEAGADEAERSHVARLRDTLCRLLLSHGLRPTARVGTPVDVRFHEVVATRPSAEGESSEQVVEIIQSGWELMSLGQAVTLRPAKVVVATNNDEKTQPNPEESHG